MDELARPEQQPVSIGLMQLTLATEAETLVQTQQLIQRVAIFGRILAFRGTYSPD